MVHDYSFLGSTADFVIKKEHLGFLPDLARKFCVARFRFLTIVILLVFVFFSFTPALKALVSAKFYIPPLKISQIFIFPHPVMIFSFCFLFFKRSMQNPIKIPTGSIQNKEIEYFTFSYIHGS
jgi:hypothetical protein